MNIYAIMSVLLVQLNKITVNEKKVAALDVIFFANIVNFALAGFLIIITQSSITIP